MAFQEKPKTPENNPNNLDQSQKQFDPKEWENRAPSISNVSKKGKDNEEALQILKDLENNTDWTDERTWSEWWSGSIETSETASSYKDANPEIAKACDELAKEVATYAKYYTRAKELNQASKQALDNLNLNKDAKEDALKYLKFRIKEILQKP